MEVDNSTMVQQPLPLAFVRGEAVVEKPQDLFIPPDALEVFLDAFEGPLDFLLYLIKKQKFNIVDLPVQEITLQYMEYVELMKDMKLELAAEYLVMAAMLAEIKSRLLLPRHSDELDDDVDPRAELIKRLQEYEVYKKAGQDLDNLPRVSRDVYPSQADVELGQVQQQVHPDVDIQELVLAFSNIVKRCKAFTHHEVTAETLSTRERMSQLLLRLQNEASFVPFSSLFTVEEGRQGAVVTFLAILELVKEQMLSIVQTGAYSQLQVRLKHVE